MTSQTRSWEYKAFISYAHEDPDRGAAKWLQTAIEAYRVPRSLVRTKDKPRRAGKVFLDVTDIRAEPSISEAIEDTLRASEFLIVVCSPRSDRPWVDAEVRAFSKLGRMGQIIPVLVEGEPSDVFPEAIREISSCNQEPDNRFLHAVADAPLAPDMRPRPGMRSGQIRNDALLKIIAALIDCDLDDLRQRDKQRRLKRRCQTLALVAAVLLFGLWFKNQADYADRISNVRRLLNEGIRLHEDKPPTGLALVLAARERAPKDERQLRDAIDAALSDMSRSGRLLKIGRDVKNIYANDDGSAFVVARKGAPGELWHVDDASRLDLRGSGIRRCGFYGVNDSHFVVTDASMNDTSLYCTRDGRHVASLNNAVNDLVFSKDPQEKYFFERSSDGRADEIRQTNDGARVALNGNPSGVHFPLGDEQNYFVVSYFNDPGEIRSMSDASIRETVGTNVRVTARAGSSFFVLTYDGADGTSITQLRRVTDATAMRFDGKLKHVEFSGRPDSHYAVLQFEDMPGELWRCADGTPIVTLKAAEFKAEFSHDVESRLVAVRYEDGSAEFFEAATGKLLLAIAADVERVIFDRADRQLVIFLKDGSAELRNCTGDVPTLVRKLEAPAETNIASVQFSPDSQASCYRVNYKHNTRDDVSSKIFGTSDGRHLLDVATDSTVTFLGEPTMAIVVRRNGDSNKGPLQVFRAMDGTEIAIPRFRRDIRAARFVQDGAYYLVEYMDSIKLYRSIDQKDQQAVGEFDGLAQLEFMRVEKSDYLLVHPFEAESELWLLSPDKQAERLAKLNGRVSTVEHIEDTSGRIVYVRYEDGRSELWTGEPLSFLLELNSDNYFLDRKTRRLIVWYPDGRAYMLSVEWLKRVRSGDGKLLTEELTELARQYSLASGFFDEREVAFYLD